MLHTVLLKVVKGLEARVRLLQVLEADHAARVVGHHRGAAQALAQHTVAGAQAGGVVGRVEDGALGLAGERQLGISLGMVGT